MKETIWINKDRETVWDFVVLEFAKAFKCSPRQLQKKEIVLQRKSKKITQTVPIQDKPKQLVLVSEDEKEIVETHYEFSEDDDGSFLTVYEIGKGKNSLIRTLFYKAQSLPILRGRRKKRTRQRLESIKYLMEKDDSE